MQGLDGSRCGPASEMTAAGRSPVSRGVEGTALQHIVATAGIITESPVITMRALAAAVREGFLT